MITLTQPPALYSLSRNRNTVKFTVNNRVASPGQVAEFQFQIKGIPMANEALSIAYGDEYVFMTFTPTPVDNGYEIGLPSGVMDADQFADQFMIPAFESNYYLSRDFTIVPQLSQPGERNFLLRAKSVGSRFNITYWSNIGNLVINAIPAQIGDDANIRPAFKTYLEVQIGKAPLQELETVAGTISHLNNHSEIDLAKILDADWHELAMPTFNGLSLVNRSNAIAKYRLRYAEAFGEVTRIQKINETGFYYSLAGGLSLAGQKIQSLQDRINLSMNFLTSFGTQKISPSQQFYLTYLHTRAQTGFRVYADVEYTDDTKVELTMYSQLSQVANPSLHVVPSGYRAIEPIVDPEKKVYKYEVWIGDASNRETLYSQKITFFLDYRAPIAETTFLYRNAYGAMEVFRATGTNEQQVNHDGSLIRKVLPWDYTPSQHHTIRNDVKNNLIWEVNSGFKTKSEMAQIHEMLASDMVWLIGSSRFIPVTLVAGEGQLFGTESGRLNEVTLIAIGEIEKGFSHV